LPRHGSQNDVPPLTSDTFGDAAGARLADPAGRGGARGARACCRENRAVPPLPARGRRGSRWATACGGWLGGWRSAPAGGGRGVSAARQRGSRGQMRAGWAGRGSPRRAPHLGVARLAQLGLVLIAVGEC
jgi:hypothetical protein